MKKNNIELKLVVAGVILFIFCVATAFFWYKIFKDEKVAITNLTIALRDQGKGVDVESLVPKSDKDAKSLPAYSFDIMNTGDQEGHYQVLIEDSVKKDSDGEISQDRLLRSQLKYELKLNGSVIASDLLSTVENNVLDNRVIDAKKTNTYDLRIWLPLDVKNWQNKIYHYKVVVKPITEGE